MEKERKISGVYHATISGLCADPETQFRMTTNTPTITPTLHTES